MALSTSGDLDLLALVHFASDTLNLDPVDTFSPHLTRISHQTGLRLFHEFFERVQWFGLFDTVLFVVYLSLPLEGPVLLLVGDDRFVTFFACNRVG